MRKRAMKYAFTLAAEKGVWLTGETCVLPKKLNLLLPEKKGLQCNGE